MDIFIIMVAIAALFCMMVVGMLMIAIAALVGQVLVLIFGGDCER